MFPITTRCHSPSLAKGLGDLRGKTRRGWLYMEPFHPQLESFPSSNEHGTESGTLKSAPGMPMIRGIGYCSEKGDV